MLSREGVDPSPGWHDQFPALAPYASGRIATSEHAPLVIAWSAVSSAAMALAGSQMRQWLTHTLAIACILGGFVGAPCVSILAWIGMVLPASAPLHQMAPTLMTGALIWLALAIIGAHAVRLDRRDGGDAAS